MVDQRRFDNQSSDFCSAREAAQHLGVRLPTLYAYVSRGQVRSIPGTGKTRARLYARADIERLRARKDARAGHGPVAAGALQWGEPVLDSSITEMRPQGPRYRGHAALDLADDDVPFERVAELLWTGELPENPSGWPTTRALCPALPASASLHDRMLASLTRLAAGDPDRHAAQDPLGGVRARRIVSGLVAALRPSPGPKNQSRRRRSSALSSVAHQICEAFGRRPTRAVVAAVDRVLVLSADHELNTSAFAARVAASAGGDLYASVAAAIAAHSGPLHGAASARVAATVRACGEPEAARAFVRERTRLGETVPGFGHPLYPDGDPRTPPLLALAQRLRPDDVTVRTAAALCTQMRKQGRQEPTLDVGLVAICSALRLGPDAPMALFALGRSAGWIAHALEQMEAGFQLRPRARFRPG